jgi:hypothetical protein
MLQAFDGHYLEASLYGVQVRRFSDSRGGRRDVSSRLPRSSAASLDAIANLLTGPS